MAKEFAWHLLSSSGGSTSCVQRSRNCISCVPRCLLHVYQLRPEMSTPSMTSCVPRLIRNCIRCVPRCLLHVYQLRPELSTPSMTSCVPRLIRNCISCVPRCLLHAYLLCTESSTARVRVVSKDMGIQNVQQFEGSYTVLLYVRYFIHNYLHPYRTVEWNRHCVVVILCCFLMFKPYWKNIYIFGGDDRHMKFLISPISSYCNDLMKTVSPERVLMQ